MYKGDQDGGIKLFPVLIVDMDGQAYLGTYEPQSECMIQYKSNLTW